MANSPEQEVGAVFARAKWAFVVSLLAASVISVAARSDVASFTQVVLEPPTVEAGSTYPFGDDSAAIVGKQWTVKGTVTPYVPGETVEVRFTRDGQRLRTDSVPVTLNERTGLGAFHVSIKTRHPGLVKVTVVRTDSSGQANIFTRARVQVVSPEIGVGGSGPSVRFFQAKLLKLGYWVDVNGVYDDATQRAVMTYRRVNAMDRLFTSSSLIYKRVARGRGGFHPKYGATGQQRVEADLTHQVLALINSKGKVYRVTYTSSGKPSTPSDLGRYRFYTKQPGINGLGMVNTSYYNRGEGIHGYKSVPNFAASHGCLRIPPPQSLAVMDWVKLGNRIDVYYR